MEIPSICISIRKAIIMELQIIQNRIYEIRGCRVMLDVHLAELYQTETRILKQSVKRNLKRFPEDFMFQLSEQEIQLMVSQSVIPSKSYFGGALPFAFTEQGVAMLSSVLKSDIAIDVNIVIMRAFVILRQHYTNLKDVQKKIKNIEETMDTKFKDVYEALDYLINKDMQETAQKRRQRIGFKK
jgi:hypothetical protein